MSNKKDDLPTVDVNLNEVVEVFRFLEEMNRFFHQEMNFTEEKTRAFASRVYPECRRLYYDVVSDWVPEDTMARLEEE